MGAERYASWNTWLVQGAYCKLRQSNVSWLMVPAAATAAVLGSHQSQDFKWRSLVWSHTPYSWTSLYWLFVDNKSLTTSSAAAGRPWLSACQTEGEACSLVCLRWSSLVRLRVDILHAVTTWWGGKAGGVWSVGGARHTLHASPADGPSK